MKNKTNSLFLSIFFATLFLLFAACSKEDDVSGENQSCFLKLEGTVTDITTGDSIDSARVNITTQFVIGQPSPPGSISQWKETYSDEGLYELDLQCDTENTYILSVTDNEKNRYYHHNSRITLGATDQYLEIQLCPASIMKINKINKHMSDQLSYSLNGFECDRSENPVNVIISPGNLNDTTDIIPLPISSEISVTVNSARQGVPQLDTTIVFSSQQGDTTEVFIEF